MKVHGGICCLNVVLWYVKETVLCLGWSLGPFGHLFKAAPALQQVTYLRQLWQNHTCLHSGGQRARSFELHVQRGWRLPAASVLPFLFSVFSARVSVGTVYSIKMLLEHQCAFVNYTTEEECGRAIQCLNVRTLDSQGAID